MASCIASFRRGIIWYPVAAATTFWLSPLTVSMPMLQGSVASFQKLLDHGMCIHFDFHGIVNAEVDDAVLIIYLPNECD